MTQTTYHKRFRMERELGSPIPQPILPDGFFWMAWDERLIDVHAEVKYLSFRDHPDSRVLPNLSHLPGCREVMRAIRFQDGFCPSATWLVVNAEGAVATVQGLLEPPRQAAIQNLGVLPTHRGLGLGEATLLQAMKGFQECGARVIGLEVTATNDPAIRLYRKIGFRNVRTLYKPVEHPELISLGVGI